MTTLKNNHLLIMIGITLISLLAGCQPREQTLNEDTDPIMLETAEKKDDQSSDESDNQNEASDKDEDNDQSSDKSDEATDDSDDSKDDSGEKEENPYWNDSKKQKLDAFIKDWEKSMGQFYDAYTDEEKLDWYGVTFPDAMSQSNIQFQVDEQPVTAEWTQDPTKKDTYNVVAIYANIDNPQTTEPYLYLFTIYNDQPVVLVTAQNQGNDPQVLNLYFSPTENQQLQQGFAQIVAE